MTLSLQRALLKLPQRLIWALIAWAVTRAILVSVGLVELPFYPEGVLAFDDLEVYAAWLPDLSAGITPMDDMWQYPPLAGVFFLAGTVGPAPEIAIMVAIVLADLALTVVLFRRAPASGWFWIIAGAAVGPVLVARFDVVPTLCAVLAVLAVAQPRMVGVWAAVGASLKVWPAFTLFIVPRPQAWRAGTTFAVVLVGILAVMMLLFSGTSGFFGGQGSRGLQIESVFALPFLIAKVFGADVSLTYRYGSMEVDAAGAGVAAGLAVALAVGLMVALAVAWWRGHLAKKAPVDVALTTTLFLVVTSRVFSPQFVIWILGVGALCWGVKRAKLRTSTLLVLGSALLTQFLYPWGYGSLIAGAWPAVLAQTIRIGLVVAAAILAAREIFRSEPVDAVLPVNEPRQEPAKESVN
ncbi:MAG: glycosyltransferase 87 family protein [Actinomycetia bacterium]|nr:glycosyltransferase 87 family protein [Actinomycetes bacterium]